MRKLIVLLLLLTGCAGQRPNGLDIMADSMDCDAQGRPVEECNRIMKAGIAQVAHDTADPGADSAVVVVVF